MSDPYLSDPDVTIYCGDALEVLRGLPDESVDAVVTSPPYLDARPEYPSPTLPQFEVIFRELGRVGWTNHRGVKQPRDSRARKTRAEPNPLGARPRSYVAFHVGGDKGNEHPAPMARRLAEHLVKLGCPPGGTVCDPFAGSGTTGLVARKLGRRAVLIDLSSDYCAMSARRLQQQAIDFSEESA